MFGVCLPSGGVVCKAFVCFLMFLYACVGCALFVLYEGGLECLPIVHKCNFVLCFLEVVLMFQPSVAVF